MHIDCLVFSLKSQPWFKEWLGTKKPFHEAMLKQTYDANSLNELSQTKYSTPPLERPAFVQEKKVSQEDKSLIRSADVFDEAKMKFMYYVLTSAYLTIIDF